MKTIQQGVDLRDSVKWFATEMERVLKTNDYKGGWKNCTLQYLSMRLTQERKELKEAIKSNDAEEIINECCDIANFAMMIAERFKSQIKEVKNEKRN